MKQVKTLLRDIFINSLGGAYFLPKSFRSRLYRLYGMNIESKNICPKCFFGGNKVAIGKNSFINYNCFFDGSDHISIGSNCAIAMNCCFITSTHNISSKCERRAGDNMAAPIVIEDGCWIGANTIILPGVQVKKGTVIAAGSVVVNNCEPNGLYAGCPARKIKSL